MERQPLSRDEFANLWATITSLDEIGEKTGLPRRRLYELAEEYKLPPRQRGVRKAKHVDVPLLFRLWSEPLEIREIAERLGLRESFVGKLARRYKLPKRATEKFADNGMRVDDPTPEQIAERAAWCRARRPYADEAKPVDVLTYRYDEHSGLFSEMPSWAV